jgi:hypothetical protein
MADMLSTTHLEQDFKVRLESISVIPKMDIQHQISRLRNAKVMSEGEAALIYDSLAENVTTYAHITEVRRRPAR